VSALRQTVLPALLLTAVCAVVAGFAKGGDGAAGAAVAGVLVVLFFLSSPLALGPVTKVSPQISLLVAMIFFVTKVVALLAVFTVLLDRDGLGAHLDEKAFGSSVIVVTLGWTVLQIRAARRVRLPLYDLGDTRP
jgi:ATP synthase protein I